MLLVNYTSVKQPAASYEQHADGYFQAQARGLVPTFVSEGMAEGIPLNI